MVYSKTESMSIKNTAMLIPVIKKSSSIQPLPFLKDFL